MSEIIPPIPACGIHLDRSRCFVDVSGSDRSAFLQNLLSQDMSALSADTQRLPACLLNVKGKMDVECHLWNRNESIWLEVFSQDAPHLVERLESFIIVDDVALKTITDWHPLFLWGDSPPSSTTDHHWTASDPWHVALPEASDQSQALLQTLAKEGFEPVSEDMWRRVEVSLHQPRFGIDYDRSHLPLEIPHLEKAISFTKGCYVGQETMARLDARGRHVAKKLWPISFTLPDATNLPDALEWGSEGKTLGTIQQPAPLTQTGTHGGFAFKPRQWNPQQSPAWVDTPMGRQPLTFMETAQASEKGAST